MLTLRQWMELVDFKITEGSEYYLGDMTLYSLESWDGNHDGYSVSIVFDPKDEQRVHIVEVCDYKNQRAYRRCASPQDDSNAWDGVSWVDLETDEDFIEKTTAIMKGVEYDTRISIPLTLTDDELLVLFKLAHAADVTFNEYIARAVQELIDREKNS